MYFCLQPFSTCSIEIELVPQSKKYIWFLSLVAGTGLLKALGFPEWEECLLLMSPFWSHPIYATGVTHSGAGYQEDRVMRALELSGPRTDLLGGRLEPELCKNSWTVSFRRPPGWWAYWGAGAWRPEKEWRLHALPLTYLPYVSLPFGASWVVSFIISKMLSWVLWVVLANDQTLGGGCGSPWFVARQSEVQVTQDLRLASGVGRGSLVGLGP